MEPSGQPSPLRATLVFLVAHSLPWNALSCASIAAVPLPRAKAYLTLLERRGVVVLGDPCCSTGPRWAAFVAEPCRYHPGGNLRAYRLRQAAIAEDYLAEHKRRVTLGRALREARGARSLRAVAALAKVSPFTWWEVERARVTVRPETYERMWSAAHG